MQTLNQYIADNFLILIVLGIIVLGWLQHQSNKTNSSTLQKLVKSVRGLRRKVGALNEIAIDLLDQCSDFCKIHTTVDEEAGTHTISLQALEFKLRPGRVKEKLHGTVDKAVYDASERTITLVYPSKAVSINEIREVWHIMKAESEEA